MCGVFVKFHPIVRIGSKLHYGDMSRAGLIASTHRILGFVALAALAACASESAPDDDSASVGTSVGEGYRSDDGLTGLNPRGERAKGNLSAGALNADGTPKSELQIMTRARAVTERLGGDHAGHFLVGMGSDGTNSGQDPAYSMGVPFDMHYHYLTGISSEGGWLSWNNAPNYVQLRMRQAKPHGQVPMFTMYGLAAHGDGNLDAMKDGAFVKVYLNDFKIALDSMKSEGGPVILHLEPDFWGYVTQAASNKNTGVDAIAVSMAGNAPDCTESPNNVAGFAQCMLKMVRTRAPNVIVGFHASGFGTTVSVPSNKNPSLDVVAEGQKLAGLMRQLGADKADFMSVDGGDRDAGCFEVGYAKNGQTICRKDPSRLWDETNATLPNFNQFFTWIKAVHTALDDMPMMVWQIPYGEPGATPGGPGAWRDNKTKYFLEHVAQMKAAGLFAAAWGNGAPDQTNPTPAFQNRAQSYFTTPVAL